MNIAQRSNWTDDRIEALKRLHIAGKTGSEIARALGGVSRNAVIGKIHRLGLAPNPHKIVSQRRSVTNSRTTRGKQSFTPRQVTCLPKEPLPLELETPAKLFKLLDWDSNKCKWAYTQNDSQWFGCTEPRVPGSPYCACHSAKAFRVEAPRSNTRPRVARFNIEIPEKYKFFEKA